MSLIISIKRLVRKLLYIKYRIGSARLGELGKNTSIPSDISMAGYGNIYLKDNVSLGKQTTMHAINAKIIIKQGVVAAKGLKISTGNHERRVGRFVSTIRELDKNHNLGLDKDVVIEEDVWLGFNVIILSGVTIARGTTVAAGSVVSRSTCPYSIWGGVPARFIKFYWNVDDIIAHESLLYKENERYSRDYLENLFNEYKYKE